MSGFKHSRRFWMLLMSTIYIYAYFPKGILSTTLCTTPTKFLLLYRLTFLDKLAMLFVEMLVKAKVDFDEDYLGSP
ncbi:hypothetical protein HanRHA438_Chr02g0091031 [Helianthus annuus]|nr:hypothetical protein HanRHA438_Chr02g0091031 [Helianthus annuus]